VGLIACWKLTGIANLGRLIPRRPNFMLVSGSEEQTTGKLMQGRYGWVET
jgi:hypothetical protein